MPDTAPDHLNLPASVITPLMLSICWCLDVELIDVCASSSGRTRNAVATVLSIMSGRLCRFAIPASAGMSVTSSFESSPRRWLSSYPWSWIRDLPDHSYLQKNCCNSKRFQIVVKINRSSIQAGACDDLITTSYDIQKGIGNCRHAGCTATDATPFFQNRHAFFKCCDGRVIDSRVRISSSFVVKQLHAALPMAEKSTGLVHRGKCGSGHRISFLYHVSVLNPISFPPNSYLIGLICYS